MYVCMLVLSGFSFIKDVARMVDMAASIQGEQGRKDVAKYTTMYAKAKAAFHARWFVPNASLYANGEQTAQVIIAI